MPHHQAEKQEHREVKELPPVLGELNAVAADLRKAELHRQPGDEGGDEHAGAGFLGGEEAQ